MSELRLITTFDNPKMTPNVDNFRVGTKDKPVNSILTAEAAIGAINVNDEAHKKFSVTTKTILESIAQYYNMDDAVVPIETDTLEVELPEAGALQAFHGLKPLQEATLTNLEINFMKFQVLKDVLYIVDPEESRLTTAAFKGRRDALTIIEAAKAIVNLKTQSIINAMKTATQTIAATATQVWNDDKTNPYSIINAARKTIKQAKEGTANMIIANSESWSQFLAHSKVKGLAFGVNYPDFNQTFLVPGIIGLKGKVNDDLADGEAYVFNTERFMVGLQSYAYLENSTDNSRGANVMRFVNFQNAGVWHQKACVKITGLTPSA